MELTRIVFRPQAMISFTHEDIAVLMACSAAHYDGTCRAVGKPGRDSFLWGIFVMTDTRAVVEEHLEFRQIDLLAKITETTPPDQRVAATALHFQFIKILHQLNDASRNVNDGSLENAAPCKACKDSGFVFPKPNLRHYCGCLKGIQKLRDSRDGMLAALKAIRHARDYFAEHSQYPEGTISPTGKYQCFDDWAADLAHAAENA